MNTLYRDNAIAKNKFLLRLSLAWALSSSTAVLVLAGVCFYSLTHRQVHWLPLCTGEEFSIGQHAYSASYLKEMTVKAADLRLTYNPETIDARYTMLTHLIQPNVQEVFSRLLDEERKTVHDKNISSVFYSENISVDVAHHQGQIEGLLHRTSHGLHLVPERKVYLLQFSFQNGLLTLSSIQEIRDAA